ncbi:hypothetical protein diail_4591 [Diaporthe ilicicola]|nr:hypothetical protein diail_4591 [Diaporthe ilicicola]
MEGYWKGITSENIGTVFSADKPPLGAVVDLLVDYNQLSGKDFLRCRRDIRPYLPSDAWAQNVVLEGAPDNVDEVEISSVSEGSAVEKAAGSEVGAVREIVVLHSSEEPESTLVLTDELEDWLAGKIIGIDDSMVLYSWCLHWEVRMRAAPHYQSQVLTRSLLLQSAHRVKSFWAEGSADAFMLLDMGDTEALSTSTEHNATQILSLNPAYIACAEASRQLSQCCSGISPRIALLLERLSEQQAQYLFHFLRHERFFAFAEAVMTLESLRTQMIVDSLEGNLPGYDEALWEDGTISSLMLTKWQLRALLMPSVDTPILTDEQSSVYRRLKNETHDDRAVKLSNAASVSPRPYRSEVEGLCPEKKHILSMLLGQLPVPATNEPATEPPSSPAKAGSADPGHKSAPWETMKFNHVPRTTGERTTEPEPSRVVPSWPPATTIAGRDNPWAGKKRACSPDTRNAKVPRVGSLKESLMDELQNVKASLSAEIRVIQEQQSQSKVERDRRDRGFAVFRTNILKNVGEIRDAGAQDSQQVGSRLTRVQHSVDSLSASMVEVQSMAKHTNVQEIVRSEIASIQNDTASDSSGLSGLRAGDIPRTHFAPSQKQQDVTPKDPSDLPKSFTTRFEPAFVRGLDRKGRPSLDAWSSWALGASFTPASNTAFLKLRTSVEIRTSETNQFLYIFVPPERIESLAIEVFDKAVHLRLALVQHGDLIGPVPLPAPTTEIGERTLSSARWLAARPALAIELLHSRVSADRWQHFGRACNEGLLKSDPSHVDLSPLYGGKGGHLIEAYHETESPPAYNDLVDPPPDVARPSRKRQRSSPTPCPDAMGKGFESYVWKVCSDIVTRQRDEMIAPFLSRMEEMEDRITTRVIDHVESSLDKQLRQLRDELDGELEGDLDDRVDVVKEEIKEYVEDQVKEQMAEQVASLEEDFIDNIMDRIEGR